jgi:alpha-N-acetylglucosaminidase
MILDLYGEVNPVWKKQSAFFGKPWIWNVLHNFGGRTSMSGKLEDMSSNLKDAINSPERGDFSGIGMAMEYFGNNPIVQEFVTSMIWEKQIPDVKEWVSSYVTNRYGKKNEFALKAWDGMLKTVYNSHKQTGTFLCERPGFYNPKLTYRTSPIPDYDTKILGESLKNLLNCSEEFKHLKTYQFDVVNLTRQFISPLAYYWILDLENAYKKKDINEFLKLKSMYLNLIKDFDVLLSTKKEYLLGDWVESAKKWGDNKQEKNLYEWNARNLITLWGEKCTEGQFDDLNNYAYKQWAGMFTDYHLVRWNKFFDEVESAMRRNENWDRAAFLESSCNWEKSWSYNKNTFPTIPKGDPIKVSKQIFDKYVPYTLNHSK